MGARRALRRLEVNRGHRPPRRIAGDHPDRRRAVHERHRMVRPSAEPRRRGRGQRPGRGRDGDARDPDPGHRHPRAAALRRGPRGVSRHRRRSDPRRAVHALDARDVRDRRGGDHLLTPWAAGDRDARQRPRARARRGLLHRRLRDRDRHGLPPAGAELAQVGRRRVADRHLRGLRAPALHRCARAGRPRAAQPAARDAAAPHGRPAHAGHRHPPRGARQLGGRGRAAADADHRQPGRAWRWH